jgi:hypothetical protein
MSICNRLVFWWAHEPSDRAAATARVLELCEVKLSFSIRERLLPDTPIQVRDSGVALDEAYLELVSEPGTGYRSHSRLGNPEVIEIVRRSPLVEIDMIHGARVALIEREQRALPGETFLDTYSSAPTLSLAPHDIWEWSMEAGDPPPICYYGRAAASLSLRGRGSPNMSQPEFCEVLVNLPLMREFRAELDAIFGESRAVWMVEV